MKKVEITNYLVIFIMVLFISGCNFSEGERTGVISKFSHKGVIVKTWEGELVLGGDGASRTNSNTWYFTVKNECLVSVIKIAQINAVPVTLSYDEPFIVFPWEGDSGYFITAMKGK